MGYSESYNCDRIDYTFAVILLCNTRLFREKDFGSLNAVRHNV